ncbi:MAG: class II fructose-bisphosphatase [Euryhalocaulis sp.]|uniref:class II fructose-bisphosphatase n=1 Tax=Euryhalocaulis sp. TaxID=2744307 RepID=UPI0018079F05|nr:class II fructose-bisphosphatase [Euryhalocaulis sp.]MBA4802067.1 class II fructose-bisphosphatase [Euryhalocaulis sp.]
MSERVRLNPSLANGVLEAAERGAIAASKLTGGGDKMAADQAAVDAIRTALNEIPMRGRIVIGEGERDEAPMLYIGEEVGTGEGPETDIALDPLEGTTLCAKAWPSALSVISIAPRGGLLHAPDTYMDKIAVGPGYPDGVVDLDADSATNVKALAKAKGVDPGQITVCVLDRDRHDEVIAGIRSVGAKVFLIPDGDIAGIINTTNPEIGIDMYIGRGAAPEGVLAASALRCVGGQMKGRLYFRNDDERERATRLGVTDFDKIYDLTELASDDVIFVASGVTRGEMLDGVRWRGGDVETESLVMDSARGTVRRVRTRRAATA